MTGTRVRFNHQTRSFTVRYGRQSKFQTADVFMPDWNPDSTETGIPEYPVAHYFKGGTWFNNGLNAKSIGEDSFAEEVAQLVSNFYGAVVIVHDYRPGGYGLPTGEDVERLFWPEILDDGALVVQFFKTIAHDVRFTSTYGNRPLTRDPDKILCWGSSSGGHRLAFSQIMPDGTFLYSPNRVSWDPYIPQFSHIANALICSTTPLVLSGFSKGGTGYTYHNTYEDMSWAFALFQSSRDADPQTSVRGSTWGWDEIPMDLKRQSDMGEHIRADNPRVAEIGMYLTAGHAGTGIPRPSLENDPEGNSAASFRNRYWRLAGLQPAPIETIRPVYGSGNLSAIADGGASGTSLFRRASGTWAGDGWVVGDIAATSGFTNGVINHHYEVLGVDADAGGASSGDLWVSDPLDNISADEDPSTSGSIAGGGYYDLHDEFSNYVTYYELTQLGNTRSRLRAGGTGNTNPDATTVSSLATTDEDGDVADWLETSFGWIQPA